MNNHTRRASFAMPLALALSIAGCKNPPADNAGAPPPGANPPPTTAPGPDARTQGGAPATAPGSAGAPPAASIPPAAPAADFREAASVLPQGHVGAWQQSGDVVRSTAANLFQIIDGAAESYNQYGVQNYAKSDYRKPGTQLVATVQIFEFGTALGAFGRYTMMLANGRDPATMQPHAVSKGGGGYLGTTQLVFWKGRDLIQIDVTDESEEPDEAALATAAREALPLLADAVETRVTGETTTPPSPLPQEGMVWGGSTYVGNTAFGVDRSGPAWVGHYRGTDGKRYRLGILMRGSPAQAAETVGRFHSAGATAIPGVGDEAFAVSLGTAGEVVVARRGNNVFVVADGDPPGQPAPDRAGKTAIARTAAAAVVPALPLTPLATAPSGH